HQLLGELRLLLDGLLARLLKLLCPQCRRPRRVVFVGHRLFPPTTLERIHIALDTTEYHSMVRVSSEPDEELLALTTRTAPKSGESTPNDHKKQLQGSRNRLYMTTA